MACLGPIWGGRQQHSSTISYLTPSMFFVNKERNEFSIWKLITLDDDKIGVLLIIGTLLSTDNV
eukprot:scaffold692_cov114-Skeletonema_dohrnii-CCMP3373.AAC.1